jgi:Holliday junction resolvase
VRRSEARLQRDIQRELRLRGFWVRKMHGGIYGVAGDPDLLAVRDGYAYGLEVKRPGERPTKIQRHRLGELEAAGAIVGVVTSLEEALDLVSQRAVA